MPLFYEHINESAKLAIWHIAEEKNFFLKKVPVHREITHSQKQLQHLAGRYLLQHLYPDFPYEYIEIADTLKPFLPAEEYHFSISHCGNYAAAIASRLCRVGVDIELITSRVYKVKNKFLSAAEMSDVKCQMPEADQLTLLWCCKEAVIKWYGSGGVDFKEHIHLKHVNIEEKIITADFVKGGCKTLQLHYRFFSRLCLVWVAT